ncbi:hypothetical protein [Blastococcus sp. CT_GayMR16]|uniref:hypothetical protein n=1 Tax=Blastococcus sp. CT_GayMR16 TaxID=2559607 RepID=UPI001074162E|nr:hypothetical protein [Blastococcus sp. CT_GayMR16]TFV90379.1 hypothetical protein E4P38_02765 [Blastococcus sp. CT_GayMR16]
MPSTLTEAARPLDSARDNPFELFVLYLGLLVGAPLLFGAPTPGSTAELLGVFWGRVWAWLLVGGCLIALTGAWWTWWCWCGRWWPRIKPVASTGLLIEQLGLIAVGFGTVIYAIGVIAAGGDSGRYVPAGLVASLGLASLWRARRIRRWAKAVLHAAG